MDSRRVEASDSGARLQANDDAEGMADWIGGLVGGLRFRQPDVRPIRQAEVGRKNPEDDEGLTVLERARCIS